MDGRGQRSGLLDADDAHGFIAPNINFTEGDEATSKLNIPVRRVDTEFDCFLSNSFGFGGTNSTLIVKKYK